VKTNRLKGVSAHIKVTIRALTVIPNFMYSGKFLCSLISTPLCKHTYMM